MADRDNDRDGDFRGMRALRAFVENLRYVDKLRLLRLLVASLPDEEPVPAPPPLPEASPDHGGEASSEESTSGVFGPPTPPPPPQTCEQETENERIRQPSSTRPYIRPSVGPERVHAKRYMCQELCQSCGIRTCTRTSPNHFKGHNCWQCHEVWKTEGNKGGIVYCGAKGSASSASAAGAGKGALNQLE